MQIRTATQADHPNVMVFYDAMNAEIGRQAFLHIQYRGGFPPNDMIVSAIDNKELFVGEEDGRIVAACIMNSEANASYKAVQWRSAWRIRSVSSMRCASIQPIDTVASPADWYCTASRRRHGAERRPFVWTASMRMKRLRKCIFPWGSGISALYQSCMRISENPGISGCMSWF